MNSTQPLAGRRILVTGATSGIGHSLAHDLALKQGATVIATGRRGERLAQLKSEVTEAGGVLETLKVDLTSTQELGHLCDTLADTGVDDLILNAGITIAEPFCDGSFAQDERVLATNVVANLQIIRALVPALSDGKTGGRILLVASLGGLVPLPYQSVYAGSKAFVVNFGLSLREELKSHGICVLVFAPGGVATEMTDIDAMAGLQNTLADVSEVTADAIHMFIKRQALSIPGWQNKLIAFIARLLPRRAMAAIAEKIYRDARGD